MTADRETPVPISEIATEPASAHPGETTVADENNWDHPLNCKCKECRE
jgi:hypothetical protein